MMRLDENLFGCALSAGYSMARDTSVKRMPTLDGRPRYRLHNRAPSYLFTVAYDFDDNQFAAFQAFWGGSAVMGKPFEMRLKLTTNLLYDAGLYVPALATGTYAAIMEPHRRWSVSFEVEIPSGTTVTGNICHVYWAGPITAPARDDIEANPIQNLPTDVIEPCYGVLPNVAA